MTADGLEIRPAGTTPHQLAAYSELLSAVFGPAAKFRPDAIAWRYRDNPAGPVVGADAWAGDRLAAHYVTCPTPALIEGRPVRGLLSLNTATHPDFQKRGLFTRLAEHAYEAGAAAGYGFVTGVANAASTPGFTGKLGFQQVAPLEAGFLLRSPRRFDDSPVQFEADWTADLIAWRLANPAARYTVGRRGALTGVWARTGAPMIRCTAYLPARIDNARRRALPVGVGMFIGLEPRVSLRGLGFVPIPKALRPSPLNLIWRKLTGEAPDALDARRVAINFLDFDPY
jgi:GNAT superfamily N-acetyltransferase